MTKSIVAFCNFANAPKKHTNVLLGLNLQILSIKTRKVERQRGHHEVLDNIKIKHVSTTRYILSPRHQIRQHVSAIL